MEAGAVQAPEVVVMQEEEEEEAQAPEAVDMQVAGVGAEEEAGLPVVVEAGIARRRETQTPASYQKPVCGRVKITRSFTGFQKRRNFVSWNRRSEGFSRW